MDRYPRALAIASFGLLDKKFTKRRKIENSDFTDVNCFRFRLCVYDEQILFLGVALVYVFRFNTAR